MKVILLHDIHNLGKANSIVEVKDGYAKNYLFKNKLAVPLTKSNKEILNKHLTKVAQDHDIALVQAKVLQNQIEDLKLEFTLNFNHSSQKAFGSITSKQIIDELNSRNIPCTQAMFPDNLKLTLGDHEVKIKIFEKIEAILKIHVKGT